jgi:hypothetical protein
MNINQSQNWTTMLSDWLELFLFTSSVAEQNDNTATNN